jgi:serine/threonine-protein kinase
MEPGCRTLADRYELQQLIATGGMGQVWRAHDVLLGRPVAVKVLRSEYTGDATFLARFRAEAQHAGLLAHRNIATVHDYGEESEEVCGEHLAYLVMELVEGEPLSAVLARERRLGVAATLDLVHQTAAALAAAHAAGVVHRDVKPGNVLMGADGIVKITDFGIAWSASDVPLTETGQVIGTAHYLSPEQAAGGKASPASDVYALGMIAYECLAGRRAFEGENAVQIALRQIQEMPEPLPADVPDPVRSLIGRALLKDPARRFPDGAAFRDAVADVLAGREVPAPPPPVLPLEPMTTPLGGQGSFDRPASRPPLRWRRTLLPAAALVAGAAIGMGTLQLVGGAPDPTTAVAGAGPGSGSAAGGSVLAGGAPTTVRLDAADYVNRPYGEVQAELAGLGLRVVLATAETSAAAPGLVTAVDPVGTLHPGDQVTVTYAVAPAAQPTAQGGTPVELALAAAPRTSRAAAGSAASGDHPAGGGSGVRKKSGGGSSGGEGQAGGSGHGSGGHHGKPHGKSHGKSHGHGGHHGKGHGKGH